MSTIVQLDCPGAENYIQFLTLQYYFLNDVTALYEHSELNMVIAVF